MIEEMFSIISPSYHWYPLSKRILLPKLPPYLQTPKEKNPPLKKKTRIIGYAPTLPRAPSVRLYAEVDFNHSFISFSSILDILFFVFGFLSAKKAGVLHLFVWYCRFFLFFFFFFFFFFYE